MTGSLIQCLEQVALQWTKQRAQRQQRRELYEADFDQIRDAGYLLTAVPENAGGHWTSGAATTRLICDALRTLAHGDSSVALVSAMHPAVLSYWLAAPDEAWQCEAFAAQTKKIIAGVKQGDWWGTITSEPGSGGDVMKTRAVAKPTGDPHQYSVTGDKHFGSGTGMLRYMVTTAVADGEEAPDWFYVDLQNVPLDGSQGVKLIAQWDGHGMIATQSHSLRFEDFPANRIAWPGHLPETAARSGPLIGCMFTAVIVGIVETAMEFAAEKYPQETAGAYEQVQWQQAQIEAWLIVQAYEGMLRAVESQADAACPKMRREVLQGKTAIADLSEKLMTRLPRILGGGTFHRRSPLGHWAQDVKALGFLRPPWPLAYETLIGENAK